MFRPNRTGFLLTHKKYFTFEVGLNILNTNKILVPSFKSCMLMMQSLFFVIISSLFYKAPENKHALIIIITQLLLYIP